MNELLAGFGLGQALALSRLPLPEASQLTGRVMKAWKLQGFPKLECHMGCPSLCVCEHWVGSRAGRSVRLGVAICIPTYPTHVQASYHLLISILQLVCLLYQDLPAFSKIREKKTGHPSTCIGGQDMILLKEQQLRKILAFAGACSGMGSHSGCSTVQPIRSHLVHGCLWRGGRLEAAGGLQERVQGMHLLPFQADANCCAALPPEVTSLDLHFHNEVRQILLMSEGPRQAAHLLKLML